MAIERQLAERIGEATGRPFAATGVRALGGGCISRALRLDDGERSFFVKLNGAARVEMFEAEADGLVELAAPAAIRVPEPVCVGTVGDQAFLVLEYIDFGGERTGSAARAGRELAALHRVARSRFGWHCDNTIGSTPQPNTECDRWVDFWRDQRLGFQLRLAASRGYGGRLQQRGERLLDRFAPLLDHDPCPSLLHGDLWGGNIGYDRDGAPVLFDPAVYFGDREADLAMTELFGGFGRDFYAAYNAAWPLAPGYKVRRTLYNLYHILNHLNLFGGGYLGQAEGMTEQLLAELG